MDEESKEFVEDLMRWLEDTQSHLNDQSRRKVLEVMTADHAAKLKARERMRARAKDFLLIVSVLTAASAAWATFSGYW